MQYQEKHVENALIKAMQGKISGFSFEVLGQQISCSVGIIDVMALLKNGVPDNTIDYLWVCEVKRGVAPDSVIAQVLSYSHLIQWVLHDRYPEALEGVSALCAESFLYPRPVIVAEDLGKMGQKAYAAGVIDFVRYEYLGLGNFKFEYMQDFSNDYTPPRLNIDLTAFIGKNLKMICNDPANWKLFHDRQLQEPALALPAIWQDRVKG